MLDNLSSRLQSVFSGLRSKGRLTEADINEATRAIRMALLEADVNIAVVKAFTQRIKERCMTAEVMDSLSPAQNVIKIVLDELTGLLGSKSHKLTFSQRIPNVIMLVGLQGSGKTTAAAKLAYLLKQQKHSPLLVACDVYRPAAADQLQTLGDEMGVRVYRGEGTDPVQIAKEGVKDAIQNLRDVVIIDTAGRLHVDQEMMDEAAAIRDATKPEHILMVVDAMTGQDIVGVAQAFAEKVDFEGVIMAKMDGDARGGGALSIRTVTGKPILYISQGERPDSLEEFHPDRMAKRILGMGDMVSLIEKAGRAAEEQQAKLDAERVAKADLTFDDFLVMNQQLRGMGGMKSIMSALPSMKGVKADAVDDSALDLMVTIINSMTKEERNKPNIINGSRRSRIAKGAGVTVQEVNQLINQYNQTRKLLKKTSAMAEQAQRSAKSSRPKKGGKKKKGGSGKASARGMNQMMKSMGLGDMGSLMSAFDGMSEDDLKGLEDILK